MRCPNLIAESRPDLVLLDLMLPGEDGIELMQRIFTLVEVPVIFISGYGRDEIIARAFEMGASDYVVKPFSPTELMARIRAALSQTGGARPDRAGGALHQGRADRQLCRTPRYRWRTSSAADRGPSTGCLSPFRATPAAC